MLLLASQNGGAGMRPAWTVLSQGGSALDAVEAATREVEDDPEEHTVGYGGYPNLLGEVELDASIMDGTTRCAGAVAALQGYRAAVSVARKVMEELPHSVLVGTGAARFAAEMGFRAEKLLTEAAEEAYLAGLDGRLPAAYAAGGAVAPILTALIARHRGEGRPVHSAGTVNFIAQDSGGAIASVSSSSGWPWKYPGRVGDAAVIGAGNYADSRYGAATCVGWGELAIRTGVARGMIARLEEGHGLGEACRRAFADAIGLDPALAGVPLRMLAMDSAGNHTCHATSPNGKYLAWTDTMSAYATLDCTLVDAAGA